MASDTAPAIKIRTYLRLPISACPNGCVSRLSKGPAHPGEGSELEQEALYRILNLLDEKCDPELADRNRRLAVGHVLSRIAAGAYPAATQNEIDLLEGRPYNPLTVFADGS